MIPSELIRTELWSQNDEKVLLISSLITMLIYKKKKKRDFSTLVVLVGFEVTFSAVRLNRDSNVSFKIVAC